MIEILKILKNEGHAIGFMPHDGLISNNGLALAETLGIELIGIPHRPDLASWLHSRHPVAALVCRFNVAIAHFPLIRSLAPNTRLLFDTVDLHFIRLSREAELGIASAMTPTQLDTIRINELNSIRNADTSFVVSEVERKLLADIVPQADIRVLSNIHSVARKTPGFEGRKDLLFIGGMTHAPNLDAARWFCTEILPHIRAQVPGFVLHIAGAMSPTHTDEFSRIAGVQAHGVVPDLSHLLRHCLISIAPLRYGAGVKGKINTAMSHGLPVVATSIAAEGMFLVDEENALIADRADTMVTAILKLHDNASLWQQLADAGKENIFLHFSREAATQVLSSALQQPGPK